MFTQFGSTSDTLSKASTMVFRIGTDAHLYDDPEDVNIAPLLDSKFDSEKCEALKRLLALIAQGFDVSNFFPQVVKNVASQTLEVKKLAYLFLLHYAEKHPNEALLSINCFQKDLGDTNPLVRAWALRTMAGIRLHDIAPLALVAVRKCARDPSVYVRKCAANALPKLHDLHLEENSSAIKEIVLILLSDSSPGVIGAAAAAFASICPNDLTLIGRNYRRLCEVLPDVEEWGQVILIGVLLRYVVASIGLVRESIMHSLHTVDDSSSEKNGVANNFTSAKEDSEMNGFCDTALTNMISRCYTEGPDEYLSRLSYSNKVFPKLDDGHFVSSKENDDIRILLQCTSPLLWSNNSAVVLAAAGVHWIMSPRENIKRIVKPLVFLLRSCDAAKYVVLCNIQVFAKAMPYLFAPHYEDFFIYSSDSYQVKALKLEILSSIATDSSVLSIFNEFQDYIRNPNRRFAADTVAAIGLCAGRLPKIANIYDERLITEKILQKLKLKNFQLGRTKIFLRAGQIGILDARRAEVLDNAAKCIQRRLQTYHARKDFLLMRSTAISLQAYCRGCLARKFYVAKRESAAATTIQKYIRRWFSRNTYLELYKAALTIQSSIRGFTTRKRFLHDRRNKAAISIQAQWRTFKVRTVFHRHQASIISIQCRWRQKLAKRELRRLKQEANEAGALRLAKNKLEKQLEDLTWRLHLEKRLRASNEEAKSNEILKLQKMLESLSLELDAAKFAAINECNKNAVLQNQMDLLAKEKYAFEREIVAVVELKKENAFLKSALDALEKKNSALEVKLVEAQKDGSHTVEKLQEVEQKCTKLQHNVKSLEEKLSVLKDENHVLRQKALSATPRSTRPNFVRALSEKSSGALIPNADRKTLFESPTPTKLVAPFSQGLSESRRTKLTVERHQENYELLSRCIKENLGFKGGKPLAACIIYKCLLNWHAFESERTVIFDYIIERINDALKVGDENIALSYWLSNASALLCLLQRNIKSNGFLSAATQRSAGSTGLASRISQGLKSPFKYITFEDGISHLEARYPAILFKQQLTACVEKIFGMIRDNLKKELSPLLSSCIQAPKAARVHAGKSSKSPGVPQPSTSSPWDNIIKFLDSLMSQLRENHVPSFFIRKLITQVFSFINISLFNSLLLRRECCTFSNGEYVKSGLAELEKWIGNATDEYSGTSWHELNYIRQSVGFLVIHQKRKKSLEEIRQDLCPALTVRQIYRISTMYWDDKYGTQSVSNEVVAQMREILNEDNQNLTSNSFLLDDDLSIPFSTEDIDMALPPIEPSDIELPSFLSEYTCAQFLTEQQK